MTLRNIRELLEKDGWTDIGVSAEGDWNEDDEGRKIPVQVVSIDMTSGEGDIPAGVRFTVDGDEDIDDGTEICDEGDLYCEMLFGVLQYLQDEDPESYDPEHYGPGEAEALLDRAMGMAAATLLEIQNLDRAEAAA